MNRFFYLLACAASTLFVTSCSDSEVSDVVDENAPVEMTFNVGLPSSETRAVVVGINDQNPAVNWETTDKIFVWGLGSTNASTFSQSEFGDYHNYSTFKGTIVPAEKYWIMYPNQTGASFDGEGIISATIPQCQKAVSGSFDPAAAICTGATTGKNDQSVSIKHACAFLKITTRRPCYSVKVTPAGDPNWYVTGDVEITASSSGSAVSFENSKNPYSYVMLTADGTENCTKTFAAGTYLIAIAPSQSFPGITVEVDYTGNNDASVTNNPEGGIQFNAAYVYNLGTAQ